MQIGIGASVSHPENGMPLRDMHACLTAARDLDEIIVFRSTGPWSKRWLGSVPPYPSKNFHVKGKSADWGPQAGFVPRFGIYSKVGHDTAKAKKGDDENRKGIASGFTIAIPLSLSRDEIDMQAKMACETPPRTALVEVRQLNTSRALVLGSFRSGDAMRFNFVAVPNGERYDIMLPPASAVASHMDSLSDRLDRPATHRLWLDPATLLPLLVMASNEAGSGSRAMTGDYDLMAICPRWANHGEKSLVDIVKPAIHLQRPMTRDQAHVQPPVGQMFKAGSRLDKVLDMRLHTAAPLSQAQTGRLDLLTRNGGLEEHGDMGNLTPRILRAIVKLNVEMGAVGANAALRRVHHNAESHRHANFGALKSAEMDEGEGFPLTAFHPPSLASSRSMAHYGPVCTIERMTEFRDYARDAHEAGFFVPRNWSWNMSVRNHGRA